MIQSSKSLFVRVEDKGTKERGLNSLGRGTTRKKRNIICRVGTFSRGNLFFPTDERVSLCEPTRTKLLVWTALGPPGLAITARKRED